MTTTTRTGHYSARERHSGEGEATGEKALTIVLPLPDPLLTVNYRRRHHWRVQQRLSREQRSDAYMAGVGARYAAGTWAVQADHLWYEGRVRVDVEVRPRPRMQRHDDTAIWEALKPVLDGFEDAGIVANDKQFVIGTLTWARERTGELVIVMSEVG